MAFFGVFFEFFQKRIPYLISNHISNVFNFKSYCCILPIRFYLTDASHCECCSIMLLICVKKGRSNIFASSCDTTFCQNIIYLEMLMAVIEQNNNSVSTFDLYIIFGSIWLQHGIIRVFFAWKGKYKSLGKVHTVSEILLCMLVARQKPQKLVETDSCIIEIYMYIRTPICKILAWS